jgi:hypothetical protein
MKNGPATMQGRVRCLEEQVSEARSRQSISQAPGAARARHALAEAAHASGASWHRTGRRFRQRAWRANLGRRAAS